MSFSLPSRFSPFSRRFCFPSAPAPEKIRESPSPDNSFGETYNCESYGPIANSNNDKRQDGAQRGKQMHFDGYNSLFADGHVKFLRPMATVQRANGTYADTNSPGNGMWTLADD